MPCDQPYTETEFKVIAAYHQRYMKNLTGCKYRHNWVFQDDFCEYYLIRQQPTRFVYVTMADDTFQFAERSLPDIMGSQIISQEWQLQNQSFLKWEPNVWPDGVEYYEHHCAACGEGLQKELDECMACGFCKDMLWLTSVNNIAFEEYESKLEILTI